MIDNLPNGWRIEELKNIGNFVRGVSYNKNDLIDELTENDITLLRANNIKEILYLKDFQFLNRKAVKEKQLLQYGDILIAMSSGSKDLVGKNVYIDRNLQNYSFGAFCSVFRTNPNKNSRYISLFFKSKYFKNSLSLNGTNINNLRITELECMKIPIPPLQQQEKIVKVLDLSSNLIEKQKELLKNYDLFLKSKFIEMFGDPITNPMGWETKKLGILADWKGGGTPSRKEPQYFNGSIPWITTVSLGKLYISEKDAVEFITNEAVMKSSAKIIPVNSIIIGTRVGVGKVSINKIELCTNQDIMSMTNISTDLSNIFLYFFINYYNEFLKSQQRGATIQGITAPVLKDLNTILPPIEIQNKFASIVEKIEIIKEKENQKLKQLEDLHNSLMQKAFKGEIE